MTLGLVIEVLVAVLLAVTIFYCVVLNKRLVALRADEAVFKATVRDLRDAVENADRAINGLKSNAAEIEETLGVRRKRAGEMNQEIVRRLGEGRALMERLAQATLPARIASDSVLADAPSESLGSEAARAARRISEYRRARKREDAA